MKSSACAACRLFCVSMLLVAGLLPCFAAVPRYMYVANIDDNTISSYLVNPATGQLQAIGYANIGSGPRAFAFFNGNLFVANMNSNSISAIKVGTNASLTRLEGFAVGTSPFALAADPLGRFLYVANSGSNNISGFRIVNGGPASVSGSPFAAGTQPRSLVVHPSGKFLYVANYGSNNVTRYAIGATFGALTGATTISSGVHPSAIALNPAGTLLFTANLGSNDVSVYAVNTSTGALTMVGSPVPAGTGPAALAVDATGSFLYVADSGSTSVSAFRIGAGGLLMPVSGSPFAAGVGAKSVTIDPTNHFLYVTSPGSRLVNEYSIDASSGALTAITSIRSRGQGFASAISSGSAAAGFVPKWVYALNRSSTELCLCEANPITRFAQDPVTGTLTRVDSSQLLFDLAQGLSSDPFGRIVYVGFEGFDTSTGSLAPFAVTSTGALTSINASLGGNTFYWAVAVDPAGRFAFTIQQGDLGLPTTFTTQRVSTSSFPVTASFSVNDGLFQGTVTGDPLGRFVFLSVDGGVKVYTVNKSTGVPALTSTFTTAANVPLVMHPSGRFLFARQEAVGIVTLALDAKAGTLSFKAVAGGNSPLDVVPLMEPGGRFGYVMGEDLRIRIYRFDETTGIFSQIGTKSVAAAGLMQMDSGGRFIYVGDPLAPKVRVYAINPATGSLTAVSGSPFATAGVDGPAVTPISTLK